jgi:putative transcriptional regulator
MTHNIDFSIASSDAIINALFERIEEIRLSRNISQATLAKEAGVSRSTITRLARGQSISVDSFVRIMQALGLADHLAALLPNPNVRPVERIRLDGTERRRASSKRKLAGNWTWKDEANGKGDP